MIGIGITSYHRPQHLELCLAQIRKFTEEPFILFVAQNVDGIAKAKNLCLNYLKDCEHIFLFDDDCFPKEIGWTEYFIESNFKHLLYLNARHNKIKKIDYTISQYNDCAGCFMYINNKNNFCYEFHNKNNLQYFNENFKGYGYEHAEYSKRIVGGFYSLSQTNHFIHSLDLDGVAQYGIEHKPSLSIEQMQTNIEHNKYLYLSLTNDNII